MTKAEYKAEMRELMQRQRELAKQYHTENAARNEAQRLEAAIYAKSATHLIER